MTNESIAKTPTAWANTKLARAQGHILDLRSRVNMWSASDPVQQRTEFKPDRMGWTVSLQVSTPPPVAEWSAVVGDAVHNMRSALDAAIWMLATRDGKVPARPRDITFPIVSDPERWADVSSRSLDGLSAEEVNRIAAVQPFKRPADEVDQDGLALLHALDINDKHRAGVSARVENQSLDISQRVEFESDEAAARNAPDRQPIEVRTPELIDGAVILEQTTLDPVVSFGGDFNLSFRLEIETPHGAAPMFETLDGMLGYTSQVLNLIYSCLLLTEKVDQPTGGEAPTGD